MCAHTHTHTCTVGCSGLALQDAGLLGGVCARIKYILCKHHLCLGTPLPPFIAHTIAQYIVSPRPLFIAIYTIQYC